MSPERIRQELTTEEYVTQQQIRNLFPRLSAAKRNGKPLKQPGEKSKKGQTDSVDALADVSEDVDVEGDGEDDVDIENDGDDDAVRYNDQLTQITTQISPEWTVMDWVALKSRNQLFPGQIILIEEDGRPRIDCLHECFSGRNSFRWPHPRDNKTSYDPSAILSKIDQPEKPTNSRGAIKLSDEDLEKARDLLLSL